MKTVIVTGASKGIGGAICRNLRTKGVRVIGVARSEDALRMLAMEKIGTGPMEWIVGNVADASIAKQAVELAIKNGQSLDGLILNAGRLEPVVKMAEVSPSEVEETFRINVFSCINWIQAALPHLCQSNGTILYTTSGAADFGIGGCGAYGASKAAMNGLIRVLANEEPLVRFVSMSPGPVDTEMYHEFIRRSRETMTKGQLEYFSQMYENKEYAQPETVAESFANAVLKAPKEMSGQVCDWNDQWVTSLQA